MQKTVVIAFAAPQSSPFWSESHSGHYHHINFFQLCEGLAALRFKYAVRSFYHALAEPFQHQLIPFHRGQEQQLVREQVKKTHNRFEFLKRTINKWGTSTNLTARAAGASFQHKLNAARNEAKALKDMQKAARKFGKNVEKVRKDFEKYRYKAATDDT